MRIGRVVGTLVATRKEPELEGLKLLLVKDIDETLAEIDGLVVAVDSVGAGVGEVVLYASGSSARQTAVTRERPVDHVVMAIVDQFEIGGETLYTKDST